MTDVTDVPGPQGPTMDDLADLQARTNRGILALERMVQNLTSLVLFLAVTFGSLFLMKLRQLSAQVVAA